MGLDMYLEAEISLQNVDGELKPYFKDGSRVWICGIPDFDDKVDCSVSMQVGYWRKANAIHKWFVDNVQGGADDCSRYNVERETLDSLRKLCVSVLKHKKTAKRVLPIAKGFFFGSDKYDEYYFEDLEKTVEIIDRCLNMNIGWDFYYQSSW